MAKKTKAKLDCCPGEVVDAHMLSLWTQPHEHQLRDRPNGFGPASLHLRLLHDRDHADTIRFASNELFLEPVPCQQTYLAIEAGVPVFWM